MFPSLQSISGFDVSSVSGALSEDSARPDEMQLALVHSMSDDLLVLMTKNTSLSKPLHVLIKNKDICTSDFHNLYDPWQRPTGPICEAKDGLVEEYTRVPGWSNKMSSHDITWVELDSYTGRSSAGIAPPEEKEIRPTFINFDQSQPSSYATPHPEGYVGPAANIREVSRALYGLAPTILDGSLPYIGDRSPGHPDLDINKFDRNHREPKPYFRHCPDYHHRMDKCCAMVCNAFASSAPPSIISVTPCRLQSFYKSTWYPESLPVARSEIRATFAGSTIFSIEEEERGMLTPQNYAAWIVTDRGDRLLLPLRMMMFGSSCRRDMRTELARDWASGWVTLSNSGVEIPWHPSATKAWNHHLLPLYNTFSSPDVFCPILTVRDVNFFEGSVVRSSSEWPQRIYAPTWDFAGWHFSELTKLWSSVIDWCPRLLLKSPYKDPTPFSTMTVDMFNVRNSPPISNLTLRFANTELSLGSAMPPNLIKEVASSALVSEFGSGHCINLSQSCYWDKNCTDALESHSRYCVWHSRVVRKLLVATSLRRAEFTQCKLNDLDLVALYGIKHLHDHCLSMDPQLWITVTESYWLKEKAGFVVLKIGVLRLDGSVVIDKLVSYGEAEFDAVANHIEMPYCFYDPPQDPNSRPSAIGEQLRKESGGKVVSVVYWSEKIDHLALEHMIGRGDDQVVARRLTKRYDLCQYVQSFLPNMPDFELETVHKVLCPGSIHTEYHRAVVDAAATLEILGMIIVLLRLQGVGAEGTTWVLENQRA